MSKQRSWDIEFLPICLNIAADGPQRELQCANVEDSPPVFLQRPERE